MYHAPNAWEDLQYVELYNSGSDPVDLSGWSFTKGIKFAFPQGSRLDAQGFLVLCRNSARFQQFYQAPVAGEFASSINRKGERIELSDAAGRKVDSVKFKDSLPWPSGPDGYSGSLERISPQASSDDPANWIASPLSDNRDVPAGTPGRVNAGFSAQLPPVIQSVKWLPAQPKPDEPWSVEAVVRDSPPAARVELLVRVTGPDGEQAETVALMNSTAPGRYVAQIPGQPAERLVRFRVRATTASGESRVYPAESEPRPALSVYVPGSFAPASVPFAWIIYTTEAEAKAARERANSPGFAGFGGFGGFRAEFFPGGGPSPDPSEAARARARETLEKAVDLSVPWFELTAVQAGPETSLFPLREVFVAKLGERARLMADLLAPGKSGPELEIKPESVRAFRQGLLEAARPHLDAAQVTALAAWSNEPTDGPAVPFASVITSRVDLEGAWYAVTLNAGPDQRRMAGLRKAMHDLEAQRRALLAEVAKGDGRDTAFREQRERAETLADTIRPVLEPHLSPEQLGQLEAWRTRPRATTVGLRGRALPTPDQPRELGARGGGPPADGPRGFGGFRAFGGPRGFGGRGRFGQSAADSASHRSAFVYYDPATGQTELRDFVQVTSRKGGQKIHFLRDQPLQGMTSLNLIFEGDMASLVEPLAYEVYRQAGMPAPQSYHVRLWQNGQPAGYHLLVEQPNRTFLHRHAVRDDGNLYKLIWYGDGLIGQHEKKTNPHSGHEDLVALVDALEKTPEDAQWALIEKNFDVREVATYFAVNMVLSHWDGFFNNYFTYHDLHGTGKWTMYPWDQDQTWGVVAMGFNRQVFFNMPLTFGMNGDSPPGGDGGGGGRGRGGFGFGFRGGAGWWRQPGWFSGPLLANPQFRKIFLARLREILDTICIEAKFLPILADLEAKLEPEVRLRAEVLHADPDQAVSNLKANLDFCRDHLRKRRQFLLDQPELKAK